MSAVPPHPDDAPKRPGTTRPAYRHARRRPRYGVRRAVVALGVVVVFAMVAAAAVVGYSWYRYNQIGRRSLALASSSGGPQNFLIVGSDSRAVVDANSPDAGAFLNAAGADQSGQRSDTIMIARVDPSAKTVDLVSFPRDLWVPIMPSGDPQRINTAYGENTDGKDGAQNLVDTIKSDFGIDINHYVEINFASFKGIVDAVGGVPMYFDTAMRDKNTGLQIDQPGCVTLDGEQGLAFARSRHLEYKSSKGVWVSDPSADLGRIARQQVFIRKVIDRSEKKFGSFDVKAINDLISSTADKLTLDTKLDLGTMVNLARAFKGFSGNDIRTHTLPVVPYTTAGGAAVLKLDTAAAEPVLNVFRGLPPDAVSPASVTMGVSNGSGVHNQATDVTAKLVRLGYGATVAADAGRTQQTTVVRYAPGYENQADQVARQLAAGATLEQDTSLKGDTTPVVLVTGRDFTGVLDQARPKASTTTTTAASTSSQSSTSTTEGPVTTIGRGEVTGEVGRTPGEPPPGVSCG